MSKPTVRQLLEIARTTHSGDQAKRCVTAALAALDAEEARTILRETRDCEGCEFVSMVTEDDGWVTEDVWMCRAHRKPRRMGTTADFKLVNNRHPDCPLNNGGQVLVRLAAVG